MLLLASVWHGGLEKLASHCRCLTTHAVYRARRMRRPAPADHLILPVAMTAAPDRNEGSGRGNAPPKWVARPPASWKIP